MTTQEAYIQGLNTAEDAVIDKFINILNGEDDGSPFPNPKLEGVRQIIQDRTDYHIKLSERNNNIGKSFKKTIEEQRIDLAKL